MSDVTKASDLRSKTDAELAEELLNLRKEHFNLRMQRATGQLSRPDQFAKVRRTIAQVKTIQAARERGEAPTAGASAPAKAAKRAKAAKKPAKAAKPAKATRATKPAKATKTGAKRARGAA